MNDERLRNCIQSHVADYKPDYMVPSYVIRLDEIPLTVNSKVDVSALPEIDLDNLHSEYVAPKSKTEKIIVECFEEVFDENISLHDDFIRLGGDSIDAIRIVSLLWKRGISCSARDISTFKTPYVIAKNVENDIEVSYEAIEGAVDLLPIQSYFFDKINKNQFTQEFILKSKEDLSLEILQNAFDELCNIHDMLRARYKVDDNDVVQEILPLNTRICEINEYDVSDYDEIKDIFIKSYGSLDISEKLIDINLIRQDNNCYLIFIVHHLIIDGVSWSVLLDDLTYIYNQMKANRAINLLRPYPYKYWVDDVKGLVENISDEEKQHWIEINDLLDNASIEGETVLFSFKMDSLYKEDNLLMLTEEEYLALAISRAYKKTYGENIIFNRESYGRDENLANVNRTVGWFTSVYPVLVESGCSDDNISLARDVYNIKTAFGDINNLGLNYASLIYTCNEFEYKYCPVNFNFLSNEFSFKNMLFETIDTYLTENHEIKSDKFDSISYGITFNIIHFKDIYIFSGDYAEDTFIGNLFREFIENIKSELRFIANYNLSKDNVICCLSEQQLGIYLDEKIYDKGNAYSASGFYDCGAYKSLDEITKAIEHLIDKHPILKGRVLDDGDMPLLVCDSYPSIEVIKSSETKDLMPFDLNKSLCRFYIVEDERSLFIFYDIHHIINDATSTTIINKELTEALRGDLSDEIDLGFVYNNDNSFNSKFEKSYSEAHKFFREKLDGVDEVYSMLDDGSGTASEVSLAIRNVRSQVEELTHELGITVGSFLNAIFAYSYSRFTGGNEVYFNFTEHGRHESYNQNALGMYVRTIPLLVDCKNMLINDYLTYVSDLVLDSMRHSVYPFRLLSKEFDLNNNVLFEYNFDLNDIVYEDDDVVVSDSVLDPIGDLLCIVNDLDDGFVVNVKHSEKYSSDTMIRFVNVFSEILTQTLNKHYLSEIDYIGEDDIRLLDSCNQTEHPLKYGDILEAFNDNLSDHIEDCLVLGEDSSYTYGQSAYLINKIKSLLEKHGVGIRDKISVFVDRNHWMLLTALASLSVGATYVPIDENHPDDHIRFMIEQSTSSAVITTDTFEKRVKKITANLNCRVLNISNLSDENGSLDKIDYVNPSDNNVACILYTSGTTGIPKAVQMTRLGILNMMEVYAHDTEFTSECVQGIFASVGFDASLQYFVSVLVGGRVTFVPTKIRLNMHKLNDYFIKYGVTHTLITTQIGKLFVNSDFETSLKHLQVAGEKLGAVTPPDNYVLSDVYGPTESNYISSIRVEDKIDDSSIGNVIWNTKVYILDNELRRVPFGAVGELYISGYQLTEGYLDNMEENQKALFKNPFNMDSGYEHIYKTGDLVQLLSDGSISYIGRKDSQVKIRGNRVELSEVESILRDLDYINDVTVQVFNHDGNNLLIAYVVLSSDLDEYELFNSVCDYISDRKPQYMVPSFVIPLDEIPVNINGKVDKRALPRIDSTSLKSEYVAPTTKVEKAIAEAFETVFNQENIGLYDDFSILGGDSITAIKIMSILCDKSINIDARDIFKNKTPYAIAKSLENDDVKYSATLTRKGSINKNMFVLPPKGGLSFIFSKFVNEIDFKGNIYLLDDFRYDLDLEEIKDYADCNLTLKYYYEAIDDIFQDGDIIVGYSLGCIYASLIVEKLEENKKVGECILIDGVLSFDSSEVYSPDEGHIDVETNDYPKEFVEKYLQIDSINSYWCFDVPRIDAHVLYLATDYANMDYLDDISSNYEFIFIDSTNHFDIIDKDFDKIAKYFKEDLP